MKIYQVELSNYCNMKCSYCPHTYQKRQKGFMTYEVFQLVIELAKRTKQRLIFLHNFGEPLLHPELEKYVSYARDRDIECSFFTNGLLMSKEKLIKLYQSGLRKICVSNHAPGMIEKIMKLISENQLDISIIESFYNSNLHSWAGQIENLGYTTCKSNKICVFKREQAFVVLWNGMVSRCCIDCEGSSVQISVEELLAGKQLEFRELPLCISCDLLTGERAAKFL